MGAVLEGWTSFNRAIMNKAMYAAMFLGLCAVVLLVHTQVNPSEETDMASKEVVDPFLANLEAHVIAKAQRRLRQRAMANRRKKHISNARAAMKTMLLNAANEAQSDVRKVEEEEAKKKAATKKKAVKKGKQFTWAQLQKGEDKAKENFANKKMGNLLSKLQAAPKADKKKQLENQHSDQDAKSGVMAKALNQAKAKAAADANKDDDPFSD